MTSRVPTDPMAQVASYTVNVSTDIATWKLANARVPPVSRVPTAPPLAPKANMVTRASCRAIRAVTFARNKPENAFAHLAQKVPRVNKNAMPTLLDINVNKP